jgi:hypothetical protein
MLLVRFSILLSLFILLFSFTITAQVFNGEWSCKYATYDTTPMDNAVGQSVIDVSVIKENTFVALAHRVASTTIPSTHYLVGYTNADSAQGRMGLHYGTRGERQVWTSGFDQVEMLNAMDCIATKDSLIFVANNDAARNILVFKLGADSVVSTQYRMMTGADSLWGIHADGAGRVYVASIKDQSTPSQILIFNSIAGDPNWGLLHQSLPLQTITLPAPGLIRGITSTDDGSVLYITNYSTREVYCYVGNPFTGYTRYTGFNLNFSDPFQTFEPAPWGITLIKDKNILAFAADLNFVTGATSGYMYGKMFFANPNTGQLLDTIDVAQWNFNMIGSYNSRPGGNTPGNASGYASTFNVHFDEAYNVYSQSYYGWTVEKWSFSGTLPIIPLTVPVELISFTGFQNKGNVILNWATASELNNKGFEVERKQIDKPWHIIGFVEGKGTTTEKNNYSFIDKETIISGRYTYRLKQIDYNGEYTYSDEIYVDVNLLPEKYSLEQNYPNPFNPSTTIKFNLPVDSKVNIKIFNIIGEEMLELTSSFYAAGVHSLNLDASMFGSGVYLYKITASGIDGSSYSSMMKMILTK